VETTVVVATAAAVVLLDPAVTAEAEADLTEILEDSPGGSVPPRHDAR